MNPICDNKRITFILALFIYEYLINNNLNIIIILRQSVFFDS